MHPKNQTSTRPPFRSQPQQYPMHQQQMVPHCYPFHQTSYVNPTLNNDQIHQTACHRPVQFHTQQSQLAPGMQQNVYSMQPTCHVNPTLYSPSHKSLVQIRRVSCINFKHEMQNIRYLIKYTPFNVVSMDTEFPGVVIPSKNVMDRRNPEAQYSLMKANVDLLNLIQVGLTISDSEGNLPTSGPENIVVVWEFAISDFDINVHDRNPESISMLQSRGLDFFFNRNYGIKSHDLAQSMLEIGLVRSNREVHWVTFHGSYDFGYLIKAITKAALPDRLEEFKFLVDKYFGKNVYDVKYMLGFHPHLFGGLETIAAKIGVTRVLGLGHQAGSDSLLTQMVYQKIKTDYFKDEEEFKKLPGHIHPLT